MNKLTKTIIAILGGIDAVMTIVTPAIVSLLWIAYSDLEGPSLWLVLSIGLISTIFKSIKIGLFNLIK